MPDAARRSNVDISRASRGACALLGMAGLLGGGVAVFVSDNQAGTVAMIGVGAAASFMALLGKVPLRWVIAGHEIDMTEDVIEATVEALTSEMSADQLDAAEAALREMGSEAVRSNLVASAVDQAASRVSLAANFERSAGSIVAARFIAAGWRYDHNVAVRIDDSRGYLLDGLATTPDGTKIAVELIPEGRTSTTYGRSASLVKAVLEAAVVDGVLTVVAGDKAAHDVRKAYYVNGVPMDNRTSVVSLNADDTTWGAVIQRLAHA